MGYNLCVGLERARVDMPVSIKALPAQMSKPMKLRVTAMTRRAVVC